MEKAQKSIVIDGIEYVPKGTETKASKPLEGMKYCIVRTYSAGVFAGYVESRTGQEVVMQNARRLWYWKGASSLSQLAMEGTKCPSECKFPCEVDRVELLNVIEILDCTEKAQESITTTPIWQQ